MNIKNTLHRIFGCCLFWYYYNPSRRECTFCGKFQEEYFRWFADVNWITTPGWWETIREGIK
jgi:hypothetical protein